MSNKKSDDQDWAEREQVFWDTVNSGNDIQPDR